MAKTPKEYKEKYKSIYIDKDIIDDLKIATVKSNYDSVYSYATAVLKDSFKKYI